MTNRLLFSSAVAALLLAIAVAGCSQSSTKVVAKADALMRQAFLDYTYSSFDSATNTLQTYVAYLDANEQRIASYRDYNAIDLNGKAVPFAVSRDIPVMQLSAHSMLACMMIHSGNTNETLLHLSSAYRYHAQISARVQRSPVPRADFVQFILGAREKLDTDPVAAWKSQFPLNTNTINGIIVAS